jgi:23S rRNA (cytidine2498-2'-O)-methyltransferase
MRSTAASVIESGVNAVLCYCRAGFETECALELDAVAASHSIKGQSGFETNAAFVAFETSTDERALRDAFVWRDLIFARQCLIAFAQLRDLPRTDRLTPILAAIESRGEAFNDVWVEAPDSDEGKALAALCKSFGNALIGALRQRRKIDTNAPGRLHVFFPKGDAVFLAAANDATSAPWPLGIPRLKFPREAPSRSTLKLEEAFLVLLSPAERERWLKPGMTAVDLGASPGGWTWQLAHRSIRTTAIDNGPMDGALMQSGVVTHLREDGFRYRPRKAVDWLVCDMVEQPKRIAALVAGWLRDGACRYAMFNLKLPMKKRYEETRACLDVVRGVASEVRARQLFHDREEITTFARVR